MISLKGKVVFITGASSGIGEACARMFAGEGAALLLAARRVERVQKLAAELSAAHGVKVHAFALDVRNRREVHETLGRIPEAFRPIAVLVNNAGLARGMEPVHEGLIDDWDEMIDTNVKGLLYVSREIIPGMVVRGEGHIVNIGSTAGHQVYPKGNVYCATKHAVNALTQGMRMDLLGTPIRVSTVDPGLVETEFSVVRFHGDRAKADKTYEGMTPLTPGDVADVIRFCVTRPAHVNVQEVIVMPTDQASVGHVHRRAGAAAKR